MEAINKEQVHKDFSRERLSPHFVYESYDPELELFFNRGSCGFVLIGFPIVGAELSAEGEIAEFIQNKENLPEGSSLQVLMVGTDKIEKLLFGWKKWRKGEIFKELASKRVKFLQNVAKKTGAIKDMFILVSLTIPKRIVVTEIMLRRREILKDTLSAIGLYTENVDSNTLVNILRNIWSNNSNLSSDQEETKTVNPHELLAEQILSKDFELEEHPDMVCLKDCISFISLEAASRPSEWQLQMMDLFLGNSMRRSEYIKSNFLIHLGVVIEENQGVAKTRAFGKRETLERNIASGLGKYFPSLLEEAEDMKGLCDSLQDDDRVIHLHQNMILIGDSCKIKESAASYLAIMRRSNFNFVPCTYDHLAVMMAAMPMGLVEENKKLLKSKTGGVGLALQSLGRGIKTVSSETKALLPIIGEWKGNLNSPGLLLTGRLGQLMYWSQFGNSLIESNKAQPNENFNLCIAGVPGSGKSVLMQELMLSVLGVGGMSFVLDYGRSFQRSCQILGGNYIEFDISKPISINPFSNIPMGSSPKEIEERGDFLGSFPSVLATMAAPLHGTNDLQQSILQKALIEVWNKKGNMTEITDIADWLKSQPEMYANELSCMLFPFTRHGQYGSFFSGKAELSLDSNIVVIETDHLRSLKDLLAVIVQIVIIHINSTMVRGNRKIPKLIMIDEAWKLLSGKRSGEFIEEATRIARKYNGSITLATQQLTDYFKEEGSAAEKAFECSSHKIIMKQNPTSLNAMISNPKLSSFVDSNWKLKRLQSIGSNPPHYSEMAIYSEGVNGVIGRLRIDPFTLLLTSTNAKDMQELDELMAKGVSVNDAINQVLQQRGIKC